MLISRLKGRRLTVSIDRINNDKDYKPGNLKWSSNKEQSNNRRSNIFIVYKGKRLTLKEAVDKYAIVSYHTVYTRYKAGWSIDKALTKNVLQLITQYSKLINFRCRYYLCQDSRILNFFANSTV